MIKFIPITCISCKTKLKITTGKNNKYKLTCPNKDCGGVSVLKFQKGMLAFQISGIGPAIYKKLYDAGVRNIVDLLTVTPDELIVSGEFKPGRALEKLMISIKSLNKIKLSSIIHSLQFENVGKSISKELEKYYCGLPYDFTGFNYSIREQIQDENSDMMVEIKKIVNQLSNLPNIEIIYPKEDKPKNNTEEIMKTRIMEMTGSPKDFGFNTKNDFVEAVKEYGVVHGKLNKDCHFLVTDNIESKTSKMEKAEKLGVLVLTYSQLIGMLEKGL